MTAGVAHASVTPNDPSFSLQWALQNTGQMVNGSTGIAGDDEDVVPAWSVTTGSRGIVVAVLDTGADTTHPDLAPNLWTNPGGVGGCAAGTHGFDVVSGESACDPTDQDTSYNGHGTHVAGIIGAVGGNGRGVTGVNWQTTILPIKWIDTGNSFSNTSLVAAIQKVIALKQAGVDIRVVNVSPTSRGTAYSSALASAISSLGSYGILFVSAAGNSGENNDSYPRYPCDYSTSNELCVTMTDQSDRLPTNANYGPNTVDLAAPGSRIYSTLPVAKGSYGYISGGSMAAAEVSGAAALVLSQNPSLGVAALKSALLGHVRTVSSLAGKVRTGGILDVCAALPGCGAALAPPVNTVAPAISGTAQAGQVLTGTTGTWDNSPTSYAYLWWRCVSGGSCSSTGVTTPTYSLTSADVGFVLVDSVKATNDAGSAVANSAPTATVTAASPGTGGTLGRTAKGSVLDSGYQGYKATSPFTMPSDAGGSAQSVSIWLNVGSSPVRARAMIYADSSGRPGSLLVASADQTLPVGTAQLATFQLPAGTTLAAGTTYWLAVGFDSGGGSVGVWAEPRGTGQHDYNASPAATNPFGTVTVASSAGDLDVSATYGAASGAAPVDSSAPAISGAAQSGQQLTASAGAWQNAPTSYDYLWSRCDQNGASCASTGVAAPTYAVGSADVSHTLRVTVTATNAYGSSSATSAQTAVVAAAGATPSTFGLTAIGSGSDTFAADRKRVNSYTLSASGSLTKLSIYLQPTSVSGTQAIRGVVYADSGGVPGALVAVTAAVSLSSGFSAGWYDLTFPTPVGLAPGTYWIGVITGSTGGVVGFRWNSVSRSRLVNTDTYSDGPSSTFGGGTFDAEQMSLFATYTPG